MYRQELPQNPHSALVFSETYIANMLQIDVADSLDIGLPVFIERYADRFRILFDAHPEWQELFLKNKAALIEIIVKELGETVH
ncbi:MAG: hypothetical protein RI996_332 [Candidatus Parcubacteria bacterium]|jgi:hypothetical protein